MDKNISVPVRWDEAFVRKILVRRTQIEFSMHALIIGHTEITHASFSAS